MAWGPAGTKTGSGSSDRTLKIWSVKTGKCESTLTVDSQVNSVTFCPDGSKIAVAHWRHIQIFDAQTQAKLGSPLEGHSSE
jgi:WD40 repeat protein